MKRKLVTNKLPPTKLSLENVNSKALAAISGVAGIVCLLGVLFAPPGLFVDWRTGGVEGGNCFANSETKGVLVKIISTSDDVVNYEYVWSRDWLGDPEIGLWARPNNAYESTDAVVNGFSSMYKKQVRCSQYDRVRSEAEIAILKKRVDTTEGAIRALADIIGRGR